MNRVKKKIAVPHSSPNWAENLWRSDGLMGGASGLKWVNPVCFGHLRFTFVAPWGQPGGKSGMLVALLLGHCNTKLLVMERFYWPMWHTTQQQQHYGSGIPTFGESRNNCVQPTSKVGTWQWQALECLIRPSSAFLLILYNMIYLMWLLHTLCGSSTCILHVTFTLPYVSYINHPLRLVRYFVTLRIRF